ncbi:MAG: hypothetical protein H6742_19695 [Alphaproteobacteria bacterium]|nr:hypothetical protein [Alphaproteobacteria bacterium]
MFTRARVGWFCLVLTLICALLGAGLFVAGGGAAIKGALDTRRTRWTSPSTLSMDLDAGKWDVAQEVVGVGVVPPLPPDLVLQVRGPGGADVPVRPPWGSSNYNVGSVAGEVRFVFVVPQDGRYDLVASGGSGTRLAVGRTPLPMFGGSILLIGLSIALFSAVPTLGIIGLVLVLVSKR